MRHLRVVVFCFKALDIGWCRKWSLLSFFFFFLCENLVFCLPLYLLGHLWQYSRLKWRACVPLPPDEARRVQQCGQDADNSWRFGECFNTAPVPSLPASPAPPPPLQKKFFKRSAQLTNLFLFCQQRVTQESRDREIPATELRGQEEGGRRKGPPAESPPSSPPAGARHTLSPSAGSLG